MANFINHILRYFKTLFLLFFVVVLILFFVFYYLCSPRVISLEFSPESFRVRKIIESKLFNTIHYESFPLIDYWMQNGYLAEKPNKETWDCIYVMQVGDKNSRKEYVGQLWSSLSLRDWVIWSNANEELSKELWPLVINIIKYTSTSKDTTKYNRIADLLFRIDNSNNQAESKDCLRRAIIREGYLRQNYIDVGKATPE